MPESNETIERRIQEASNAISSIYFGVTGSDQVVEEEVPYSVVSPVSPPRYCRYTTVRSSFLKTAVSSHEIRIAMPWLKYRFVLHQSLK